MAKESIEERWARIKRNNPHFSDTEIAREMLRTGEVDPHELATHPIAKAKREKDIFWFVGLIVMTIGLFVYLFTR